MTDKSSQIITFLQSRDWLLGTFSCKFLAAGEYNENYIVSTADNDYVFRINHGTQLGLSNQIEYEFHVLEAVEDSGVTPTPYHYTQDCNNLGLGVLLMEYIPGTSLDYHRNLDDAASIFAKIHSLPTDKKLIRQENPPQDISKESHGLIHRYPSKYYQDVRTLLLRYYDKIMGLSDGYLKMLLNESLCIVNTEVNSGNFIINESQAYLVDWEKAVVSYRYQDLAHFLVPTTTLWKADYRLSPQEREQFLRHYHAKSNLTLSFDELYEKTSIMEEIILLRAMSWCYMAYHEYTITNRELVHNDTFDKIVAYLNEAECFLA
ncbi:MAG: aminoglycoside phosphotransferase family protein [Deltaproteobacteria bacterium]|nr:aminoglycoside phosphotransferase family protein [Deltaproteobacteria bacterium]